MGFGYSVHFNTPARLMGDQHAPGGWDACCMGARQMSDFDPEQGDSLTTQEVYVLLWNNQTGIDVAVDIQLLIFFLWMITSLVKGFALFDGALGEVSAVSHIGWWAGIEAFVIYVGSRSTKFGLHYTKKGVIQKGIDRTMMYLWFYQIVVILGVISHGVHVGLSIVEASKCSSTLCTDNYAFLIVFILLLFVLIFMMGWVAVWLIPGYRSNLKYSLGYGKNNQDMMGSTHDRPSARKTETKSINAPIAGALEGIETPLLKQMRSKDRATAHGARKFK